MSPGSVLKSILLLDLAYVVLMEFLVTEFDPGWLCIMVSAGAEGVVDFVIIFF